jgi:heptosyltransferase-2
VNRTLIVAPQWIGDAVMCEPLLRSLAARGETICVAALPWVAPVFRAMPQVGEIVEWPFAHGRLDWTVRRRVAAELRGRFDAAYVLPNSLKSALIPWLARIPRRIGYHGEGRHLLLNRRLPNPPGRPPMVAFYGALAGTPLPTDVRPRLRLAAELQRRVATLARALYTRHRQPVLLLGSGKEAALCEQIAQQAEGACRVLAGTTTLLDAMALIAGARGAVSNDSGLMHVAAGFGVPQAAVFGSTSPEHTPPLNPRARVLWLKDELQLDCAPCFDRVCRFGHTRCLTGVSAERVDAALGEALAAPAP